MSDRDFRDYCMTAFIGAASGLGDVIAARFSGSLSGLSVVICGAVGAVIALKTYKARHSAEA